MLILLLAAMFLGTNIPIGLSASGGVSYNSYSGGHSAGNLDRAYIDLLEIERMLSDAYRMQSTYGASGTNLMDFSIDSQNVPPHMVTGRTIRHVLGGNVDIISRQVTLEIVYENLSISDCIQMVERTGANDQDTGIVQIRIGEGYAD